MSISPDEISKFLPALGPIVAAFIAAASLFLLSVLSKEHKTSEFRQAWIDALRNDLAEFISANYLIIYHGMKISTEDRIQKLLEERHVELKQVEMLAARIKLRLNFSESDHICLAERIDKLTKTGDLEVKRDSNADRKLINELIDISGKILKDEWKRVKRGEILFIVAEVILGILFFIFLIFGIGFYNDHFMITYVFCPECAYSHGS